VAADGDVLRSELLLVPHHGSRTSSSAPFLDAVQPRFALIRAGYRKRFGHLVPEVLPRYVERGIELWVSPACGAWLRSAADAPSGRCQRDLARRYWHHGGAPEPSAIEPMPSEPL